MDIKNFILSHKQIQEKILVPGLKYTDWIMDLLQYYHTKKRCLNNLKIFFFPGIWQKNLKNVNKENKTQKIKICQA